MGSIIQLAVSLVGVFVLARFGYQFRRMYLRSQVTTIPSIFFLFGTPLRFFVPNIPLINPINRTHWAVRFERYRQIQSSVFKTETPSKEHSSIWLADKMAIKTVSTNRKSWAKPIQLYKVLDLFGKNLVTTEGPEWKAHRRIVGPSFSEGVYKRVWDTSLVALEQMFQTEGLADLKPGEEIQIEDVTHVTMRLALVVIAREAFSFDMEYESKRDTNAKSLAGDHTMSAADALAVVSQSTLVKVLCPNWMYKIPNIPYVSERLAKIKDAFTNLDNYMLEMMADRRASSLAGEEVRSDLFDSLWRAADDNLDKQVDGETKWSFSDREVVGNTFIFLLAGHETNGHTMSFVFVMLALHPEKQVELLEHILTVLPRGRQPIYEDFQKLTHTMAVLYETLRLFPAVAVIPKVSTEDTTLKYQDIGGDNGIKTIFVPKGTDVTIDTPALHTNPLYWKDPLSFKPERFLEDYEKDAFIPFSAGPRACVGRRFAEVSNMVFLSLVVRDYEVVAIPRPGETEEAMRDRLVRAKPVLTLTPCGAVDLMFKRRA
uniref:Cyp5490A1 n=1 Tax=Phaffia rhodozyma TaxID=264483 RepID=A0A221SAF0_PHARH|nr:Cyp5490A1 [Phaffia rhodozyma]